jgi:AcrR family transcriptional regulator
MGRWEPGARGRLEKAAMELYLERGFDQVTVADIAERADLTERTFFRYFADKREVLFGGSSVLGERLAAGVAAAPTDLAPLDALAFAFDDAALAFFDDAERPRARQTMIDSHPGLQERELIKLSALAATLAEALRRRGVAEPGASLAAEAGVAVFKNAFGRWLSGEEGDALAPIQRKAFDEMKAVAGGR